MYIGIDLGTSGVKAILLNEQGEVVASHTEKLTVSRPHPLWSEQDPEQWWLATDTAMKALGAQHSLRDVKALGIAGQMHGATLLDKSLQVLRPAILWNDGRCAEECQLLEDKVSASRQITGNLMMPGFTAPKLLWVQRHEAAVFSQVDKVLLPKDYLRLRMTGELASDMSDAAGTMWLGICRRRWWWAAGATTPRARSGSAWPMPVRRCCRWAPQASTSPSVKGSLANPKARCTASAMPCRAAGI